MRREPLDEAQLPASVRLGGIGRAALLARTLEAGVRLNPLAQALFCDERFQTRREAARVGVVATAVTDLGFPSGATFGELTEAAGRQGLLLCPLELGPLLRLQFWDQAASPSATTGEGGRAPPGAITVASAPPSDGESLPWGFYLRRIGNERWLRGYRSWSGHVWSPGDVLVYLREPRVARPPAPAAHPPQARGALDRGNDA